MSLTKKGMMFAMIGAVICLLAGMSIPEVGGIALIACGAATVLGDSPMIRLRRLLCRLFGHRDEPRDGWNFRVLPDDEKTLRLGPRQKLVIVEYEPMVVGHIITYRCRRCGQ